ncbi:MAG TPA: peptide ABC transporter substrate-binding protein [Candidatus Limnocylindria bacterium]|nr:peptide ABC transporter substrate-binding protein [Candidatus Limnocylindria bacterium]
MKRALALISALAFAASACAPAPTGGGATGAPTGPAEAPVRGGTAIVAIWQEPSTLAPHYANQTVTDIVNYGVLEGLAETTNEGEYVPTLATRIPTVGNGGAVVKGTKLDVTWELKPGLKWSDGAPVTSADIKFTWEITMKDPKVNNRTGFSEIESIDTPNELTAVVHYKSIYAPYPLNFGGTSPALMPKHLLEKEADISKTEYVRKPIGTGPFKVADFKAGDSITLEKNPNYRGAPDKPYLDKIVFKSVPSSEVAIAQLKAGEVHAMWNLTESQTPEVEKEPKLALQAVPGPSVERMELNTAKNEEFTDPNSVHPVLGDIEVRKAILYATPKQQLIDKLLFGKGKPGTSPVSQGWAAYREPQEAYDQKKANETLDKAGWAKGGDGIRSKGGVRASLTLATTSGNQLRERVQQVLVDEYKAIGIEVKIQNQPSSVILSGSCTGKDPRKLGTFDMLIYASSPGIDPHSTIFPRYHSKNIPTRADCSGQNYTRFKDPVADKAIEEAGATLDQDKRKQAYATAMKQLNAAYVIVWLYDRQDLDARSVELRGWKANTWQRFTWNTEDWYLKK